MKKPIANLADFAARAGPGRLKRLVRGQDLGTETRMVPRGQ
jgi:hypothetical protein